VASQLRTPRLVLRPLRDDDRSAVADLHAHPDVWQVFGDDPADVTSAAQRFVASFIGRDPAAGDAPWAIEPAEGPSVLIGIVGLWPMSWEPPFAHWVDPCIEIGWRLARPWWGRGLVTEAAATCLADAEARLGLPEVVAYTSHDNVRSQGVMTRLGMLPDPDAGFDHPRVPPGDPRRRHVVFRTNWRSSPVSAPVTGIPGT
jgi:RimJ/RimL family protein N-acetyltransferase